MGGGQPNHYEQVWRTTWVRKGDREPIKCWNNMFSAPTRSNPKLDYYAPTCVDGVPEIHPPDEAVFEDVSMWMGCLVAQFFDKRLPIHVVRATVDRLWGKHELPNISTTDNGLYLFRFRDMDARDWVMENGPWYIAGRPIILRVDSLSVVCILETRVRIHNRVRIFNSTLPGWELHHNYEHAELGRIWVCWDPRVVEIVDIMCNDQAILCYISILKDNSSFFCSAIYASNNQVNRRALWNHLQLCASRVGSEPWFLMGDFNTTRFTSEKIRGNISTDIAMEDFHDCLFNLELDDMPFNGPLFTWINRRVGDQFIARKLDRSLQNECVLDMFPRAVTEVLNPGLSDHCPLIVNLNNSDVMRSRRRCPFKFFNFWADHPSFLDMVKDAWDIDVYGNPMYRLTRKLRSVKNRLKAFNFHVFANVQEKVVEARGALYRA